MQGFPHIGGRSARAVRAAATALGVTLALAASASAEPAAAPQDPSEPGAYCAIGQCRPVSASLWTPLAFAATVVVIGSRARRGASRP